MGLGIFIDVVGANPPKDEYLFSCFRIDVLMESKDITEGYMTFPNTVPSFHRFNTQGWVIRVVLEEPELLAGQVLKMCRQFFKVILESSGAPVFRHFGPVIEWLENRPCCQNLHTHHFAKLVQLPSLWLAIPVSRTNAVRDLFLQVVQ